MQKEQVEAIVQDVIERYFGDVRLLEHIREALRTSNLSVLKEGQSMEIPKSANLIQSILISHSNLAQALGDAVNALQSMEARLNELEQRNRTCQEALLDLHQRLSHVETPNT